MKRLLNKRAHFIKFFFAITILLLLAGAAVAGRGKIVHTDPILKLMADARKTHRLNKAADNAADLPSISSSRPDVKYTATINESSRATNMARNTSIINFPSSSDFINLKRETVPFTLSTSTANLSEMKGRVVSISIVNIPVDGTLAYPTDSSPERREAISIQQTLRSLVVCDATKSVDYEVTGLSNNFIENFASLGNQVKPSEYNRYASFLRTPIKITDANKPAASSEKSFQVGAGNVWIPFSNTFVNKEGFEIQRDTAINNHVTISLTAPTKLADIRLGLRSGIMFNAAARDNIENIKNANALMHAKLTSIGSIIVETDANVVYRATNIPLADVEEASVFAPVNTSSTYTQPLPLATISESDGSGVDATGNTATNTSLVGRSFLPWIAYSATGSDDQETIFALNRVTNRSWVDETVANSPKIRYGVGFFAGGSSFFTPISSGSRLEYEVVGVNAHTIEGAGSSGRRRFPADKRRLSRAARYSNMLGCFNDFSDWKNPTGDSGIYESVRAVLGFPASSSNVPPLYHDVLDQSNAISSGTDLPVRVDGSNNTGLDRCSLANLDFLGEIGSEQNSLGDSINRKITTVRFTYADPGGSIVPYNWQLPETDFLGSFANLESLVFGDAIYDGLSNIGTGVPVYGELATMSYLRQLPELRRLDLSTIVNSSQSIPLYPTQLTGATEIVSLLKNGLKIYINENSYDGTANDSSVSSDFKITSLDDSSGKKIQRLIEKTSEPVFSEPLLTRQPDGHFGFSKMFVNAWTVEPMVSNGVPFWDFITPKIDAGEIQYVFTHNAATYFLTKNAVKEHTASGETTYELLNPAANMHDSLDNVLPDDLVISRITTRSQANTVPMLNEVKTQSPPIDRGTVKIFNEIRDLNSRRVKVDGNTQSHEIFQEIWKSHAFWNLDINQIKFIERQKDGSLVYFTSADALMKTDAYNSSTGRFSPTVSSLPARAQASARPQYEEWKKYWAPASDGTPKEAILKPKITDHFSRATVSLDGKPVTDSFVREGKFFWDKDMTPSWIMQMTGDTPSGNYYSAQYFTSTQNSNQMPSGNLTSIPNGFSGTSPNIGKLVSFPMQDRPEFGAKPTIEVPSTDFNHLSFAYIAVDYRMDISPGAITDELKKFFLPDAKDNNTLPDSELPKGIYHAKVDRGVAYFSIDPSKILYRSLINFSITNPLNGKTTQYRMPRYFTTLHDNEGNPFVTNPEELVTLSSISPASANAFDYNLWNKRKVPLPTPQVNGAITTSKMDPNQEGSYIVTTHRAMALNGKWFWEGLTMQDFKALSLTNGESYYRSILDIPKIDQNERFAQVSSLSFPEETDEQYVAGDVNNVQLPVLNLNQPLNRPIYEMLFENSVIDTKVASTDCVETGRSCVLFDGSYDGAEYREKGYQLYAWKGRLVSTASLLNVNYVVNAVETEIQNSRENYLRMRFFSTASLVPADNLKSITSLKIGENLTESTISQLDLPVLPPTPTTDDQMIVRDEHGIFRTITTAIVDGKTKWNDAATLAKIKFISTNANADKTPVYYTSLTDEEINNAVTLELTSIDLTRSQLSSIASDQNRRQENIANKFLPLIIGGMLIILALVSVVIFEVTSRVNAPKGERSGSK